MKTTRLGRAPLGVALPGEKLINRQLHLGNASDDLGEFVRRATTTEFNFPKRPMGELTAVAADELLEILGRDVVQSPPPPNGVFRDCGTLHTFVSTTVCCLWQEPNTAPTTTVGCR